MPGRACEVLLINPPWLSKDTNIWHGIKAAMPPLGILSIASYLEQEGVVVRVIDAHVERLGAAELRQRILDLNPRIVGITMMTATCVAAHQIAKLAREALPEALIVVGGVHAEAMPDETLRNAAVDLVVRGDGELALRRLVRGESPASIRGLSCREGGRIVHTPPAELVMDLDSLPFPAYHLVPMDRYYPAIGAYRQLPAINMLMTRGCPGKCTFCNSAETVLRSRSAESVVEEIVRLKDRYGIREIQFYDDTFTVNRRNVLRFCEIMEARRVGVTFTAFVRTDCFGRDMAFALKRAGCHQVMFGIESGDDEILKNIRKPISRERTAQAVAMAREAGLEIRTTFIFGNMGETMDTMRRTLEYTLELDPDLALFNVNTPYPGTQLFQWAKQHGHLVTEDWNEYELSSFLLRLPTVSGQEVLDFYAHAHRTFYMRPKAWWRRLSRVSRPSHVRDLVHAAAFILLRHKLGARGAVRREWMDHKKEDFFDYAVEGGRELLTSRIHKDALPESRFAAS